MLEPTRDTNKQTNKKSKASAAVSLTTDSLTTNRVIHAAYCEITRILLRHGGCQILPVLGYRAIHTTLLKYRYKL